MCKPVISPLEVQLKFWDTNSPMMTNVNCYLHLLGKLIYLTVTHLEITYDVSVFNQLK